VETVNVITVFTYLLFLFLIVAIFVERTVEIFVSVVKYVDLKLNWYKRWNRKAEELRTKLDQLYGFQGSNTGDKKKLFNWILWKVVTEKPNPGGRDIIAAKSIRTRFYRAASRVFSFLFSLAFAVGIYNALNVDLVTVLIDVSGYELTFFDSTGFWMTTLKIIVTAALLSAGSEPLHHVITKVEKIGESKKGKQS